MRGKKFRDQSLELRVATVAISLFLLWTMDHGLLTNSWASDVKAQLSGTAISNQFQVLDNTGKVVGFIDARGNAVFTGSTTAMGAGIRSSALTSTGTVTVQGASVLSTTTISNSSFTISGGGGDALVIRNGGDFRIYNAANTGSALVYVDTDKDLVVGSSLTVTGKINSSGAVVIKSSATYQSGSTDIGSTGDNVFMQLAGMRHSFTIPDSGAPATIVVHFSAYTDNNGSSADDAHGFRILIGGTEVALAWVECGLNELKGVSLSGARTGLSAGTYEVVVQAAEEWSGIGSANVLGRSLVSYWFSD